MKNTLINKTFTFGKVAYRGNRRAYTPEVTLELRNTDTGLELSICGAIRNTFGRMVTCGQILDTMKKHLAADPTFMRIFRLWDKWHLNTMNAGTEKQAAALEKAGITDYVAACEYLKTVGLYVDALAPNERLAHETDGATRTRYEYGHGWITRTLPAAVVDEIYTLCGVDFKAVA